MNFKGFLLKNVVKMRQKGVIFSKSFVRHEGAPLARRQRGHQNSAHSDPFEPDQPQACIFNDTRGIPRLVPLESHAQTRFFRVFAADTGFQARGAHVAQLVGADRALYFGQQFMFTGAAFVLKFAQHAGVFSEDYQTRCSIFQSGRALQEFLKSRC